MGKQTSRKEETMTFQLTPAETASVKAFCSSHIKHAGHMSAGEAFSIIITPSLLGDLISVQCLSCGETVNVTDYEKF